MSKKQGPAHVVVDGSNIATEGRSMPSLAQLNEAVMSFMDEHPDAAITVVVDATFGHRIDKKEVAEFEAGISNNELVAPPAGAVGRGDAFVLGIADKAGSSILSNDSFQEFHGDYDWLFDEGRLIGGKPVPHVGWVWVDRVPVRGPVSRKATRGSSSGSSGGRSRGRGRGRRDEGTARVGSAEANAPMPVPKGPPPRVAVAKTPVKKSASRRKAAADAPVTTSSRPAPKGGDPVNELMPFLEFVEHQPAGSSVEAVVESYSSHGAYVDIVGSDVRGYVPLRMMADPTPRSAKSVMKIGETVSLVVVSFAGARRSIDCAVPDMAAAAIAAAAAEAPHEDESEAAEEIDKPASKKSAARKTAAKKKPAAKKSAAKKATAKKVAPKKSASSKPAAKKKAATKSAAKKSAVKKVAVKKSAVKKLAAKKTPVKKAVAKKATAKKVAAKNAPVKKGVAKKATVKKVVAKKAPAKKAPVKKAAAKKAAAKKAAVGVKRAPVKKTPVKKTAGKTEGTD